MQSKYQFLLLLAIIYSGLRVIISVLSMRFIKHQPVDHGISEQDLADRWG